MTGFDLERATAEAAERWQVPALSVGILAADGSTRFAGAGGAGPDARFRVASVTKPFTATLAGLLARDGLLDLDEDVEFRGVTLRAALSHTSGLPCEHGDLGRFGDGDDVLVRLVAELPPPGLPRIWSYCNAGYWLAGAACARAAGTTYEQALRTRVLEPLGLESTGLESDGVVAGHDPWDPVPESYPRARRPSGGLVSTAGDLLRFAAWHLDSLPLLREPAADAIGRRWGLGWGLGADGVVGHDGSWGGFRSRLALVPEARVAVVVLASSAAAAPALRALSEAALRELAGIEPAQPRVVSLPRERLAELAGLYRHEAELRVDADGDGLRVESGPYPPFRGLPVSETEFVVVEGDDAGHRFDFPLPGWARLDWRLARRVA